MAGIAAAPAQGPSWLLVTSDPILDLVLLVVIGIFLAAYRHSARQTGKAVGPLRIVSLIAAVLVFVIAVNSSIGIYATQLFSVHMIQHLLLIMVVPPLLIWALPPESSDTGGAIDSEAAVSVIQRVWRVISSPVASLPIYAGVVVLTHLTSFQEHAIRVPLLHTMENLLYLVTGYLLLYNLIQVRSTRRELPYLIRFVFLAVAMGVDTLTGVALMLTDHALAPGFAAGHPGWGQDVLTDQSLAGALMWFCGDGLMMIMMITIALQWGTRAEKDQGLGSWLEGIRTRQLMGELPEPGSDEPDYRDTDLDQRILDAYNVRMARLNAHASNENRR